MIQKQTRRTLAGLATLSFIAVACGSYDGAEQDVSAQDVELTAEQNAELAGDESIDPLDADSIEKAIITPVNPTLNSGVVCGMAKPNATFDERLPESSPHASPSSYGITLCGDAYFVNIDDLEPAPAGINNGDWVWPGVVFTSTDCARHRLLVHVWERRTDGSVTYKGVNQTQWGVWHPASAACYLQFDLSEELSLTPGRDYHIGASARRHSVAGDVRSSYTTTKLHFRRRG